MIWRHRNILSWRFPLGRIKVRPYDNWLDKIGGLGHRLTYQQISLRGTGSMAGRSARSRRSRDLSGELGEK